MTSINEKIKEKFAINNCKLILEKDGKKFSDEETLMVRDFFILISQIVFQTFEEQKEKDIAFKSDKEEVKIIQLYQTENSELKNVA
jgi:hypothetical protein